MNACFITLLGLALNYVQPVKVKVINSGKSPIEGVYTYVNNQFYFSDSNGEINIPENQNTKTDSITFSHLGFKNKPLSLKDLTNTNGEPIVTMDENIIALPEVVVKKFDEKDFVKKAIKQIPANYEAAFSSGLYLNADIMIEDDKTSEPIIQYKGGLLFKRDANDELYVAKNDYLQNINPNKDDYIYTVKPYNFTSIISVTSHPIIRKFKKFHFYKHEYVSYKGEDAVKIYFNIDRSNGGQSGYMIINSTDYAIMSICYSINPINNWICEKTRRGFAKTSIGRYYVEADYSKGNNGKYTFDSGRENIKLEIHVGGKQIMTSSDAYLKRASCRQSVNDFVKLKDIF